MALGIALRYVLEALKQNPSSKMYMFGTTALDRFKSRLKDCASYCSHILAIPHFSQFPKHLIEVYIFYYCLPLGPTTSLLPVQVCIRVFLPVSVC